MSTQNVPTLLQDAGNIVCSELDLDALLGFFIAQWLGYGFPFSSAQFSWRFPLAFQCFPGLILFPGIFFLKESPCWLVERDLYKKPWLRFRSFAAAMTQIIDLEYRELRDVIAADRVLGNITWLSIITKASWYKRILFGCGVQAFGPLSGIHVRAYMFPVLEE
ncbi:uncharacterized protein EKO05_0005417 [Ascochyta rabiei]|uniref:Substrate-specific transmembrane transporter n=1 Tax=Didymella rabiei TaxID=5454 RepID=A0A163JSR3_DIDRA|nr:uncharacterized protein EKO05_0005417 [Ascochyta rabiei]KZM26569.1 substrate-specific transmembrane transporter [Ascochyta rabiei]UPX14947.1 hypothetical protein EKO05_0005417 [Ascochyta rabiei]